MSSRTKVELLVRKGVKIPNPQSVEIGDDLNVERIASQGVTIHSGCKLYGAQTYIAQGAQLGFEAPVTVNNCCIGAHVALKGGFFEGAVFLEHSSCGSGAHVREGTILEEYASIAHTVGLKQTILFPYVTLGSLINFCDCLMAGGTGPHDHSEVGSAYIHFNFTPDKDKATASLIGDVPQGVMLNQSPIFMGGQGGLVGPCQITYGTVLAAGSICRKDQLKQDQLVIVGNLPNAKMPISPGAYRNLKSILTKNFYYLGNLFALHQWYRHVRRQFVSSSFPLMLWEGLSTVLQKGIAERIEQLERLKKNIEATCIDRSALHTLFCRNWPQIKHDLQSIQQYEGRSSARELFLNGIHHGIQKNGQQYIDVVQSLDRQMADTGMLWLRSIADRPVEKIFSNFLKQP